MFCIKFLGKSKVKIKEKFEVAFAILNLFPIKERGMIYLSDYTFSIKEDSKRESFIQSTIMSNEAIINNSENANKFIKIVCTLKNGKKIYGEIIPNKARQGMDYVPNIQFCNEDEDISLYPYFKRKSSMKKLLHVLSLYDKDIDESYFYDPLVSEDCYNDVDNRLWQKRNNLFSLGDDLISEYNGEDPLSKDTNHNLAYNFVESISKDIHKGDSKNSVIQNAINSGGIKAGIGAGSIILQGEQVSLLVQMLREKLAEYINSIKEQNIYETEFKKVFKSK
jgi:hypothetical protein